MGAKAPRRISRHGPAQRRGKPSRVSDFAFGNGGEIGLLRLQPGRRDRIAFTSLRASTMPVFVSLPKKFPAVGVNTCRHVDIKGLRQRVYVREALAIGAASAPFCCTK
jgi:hypothetical protein